jgi:hypothetical protein
MKRLTWFLAAISLVAGGCLLCAGLFATSFFWISPADPGLPGSALDVAAFRFALGSPAYRI